MESDFGKNVKEYPFTLLREEADERDAFKNHTHENVADALAVLIEQEKGGLTVGVEGPWGGGKSTVLKILRRKLIKSYFFFFDAWAHEGDSLRRVFLESLCEYFKGELKGDKCVYEKLDALGREIDGRRVVTTTSSTRKPTLMGILSVVSASAAALGVGILSVSRDSNNQFCPWMLGASIAFLACPAALVIGRFVVLMFQRWFGSLKKFWTVDNWAFLQDSSIDETTRDVTEEDERSSVEFERFFAKIVDCVMSIDKRKQLVIAIDNLDRINPEDSFRLWSTLQTFLQKRSVGVESGDWFNRLWILVPYDAEGLSKLWNKDGTSPEMVKSFMDKCFQIRIEVPRPLMSDWESFAKAKIEESLGKWSAEEKKVVFEILRNTRAGILDIPTPREIKNYINQVAVIRNHARSGISTAVISYYVLSRYQEWHASDKDDHKSESMSVEDIRRALVRNQYPEYQHRVYLGNDFTAMFAGLIFGVEATSGHELLLGPEIEGALKSGDNESLQELESIHKDGFWNVLDTFLRKQDRHITSAPLFADFLHRCGAIFRSEFNTDRLSEVRRYVLGVVNPFTKMKIEELAFLLPEDIGLYDDASDMVKLVNRFGDQALVQKLYALTIATLNFRFQKKDAPLPKDYGVGIEKLLTAYPDSVRKVSEVSGLTFARLAEFVPGLDCNSSVLPTLLKPTGNSFVSDFIKNIAQDSEISSNLPVMMSFPIKSKVTCDWTPVVDRCIQCLYFNNGFVSPKVPATCILDVLIQIVVADEKMRERVRPIFDDWRFYNYVGHDLASRSEKAALLSSIVAGDKVLAHNVQTHTNETKLGLSAIVSVFNSDKIEVAQALLSAAGRFKAKGLLWNICSVKDVRVFNNLVKLALSNETDNAFFNFYYGDAYVDDYLAHIGKLGASDAGEACKELVTYLCNHCNLWEDIEKNALTEDGIINRSAALAAIVDTGLCPDEVLKKIIAYLSGLSADAVTKMIGEGDVVLLLQALRRKDKDFRLAHEYYKALGYVWDEGKGELYKKVRDELLKIGDVGRWATLVEFCPVSMRDRLSDDIVADYKKMNAIQRSLAYPLLKDELEMGFLDGVYWEKETWEALKSSGADVLKMYAEILAICAKKKGWLPDRACQQKYSDAINSKLAAATDEPMKEVLKELAGVIGAIVAEVAEAHVDDEEGKKDTLRIGPL